MKKLFVLKFIFLLCSVASARETVDSSISSLDPMPVQQQKFTSKDIFVGIWCNREDENDQLIIRPDQTFSYFENGNFVTKNWYKQLRYFATSNQNQSGVGFGYDTKSGNVFFTEMRPSTDPNTGDQIYQAQLRASYSRCTHHFGY